MTAMMWSYQPASGQTSTRQQLIWYGLFSTVQLNENWSVLAEIQERHFIEPEAQHQALVRVHARYKIGKSGWESVAGMAFFIHHPGDPEAIQPLITPELRPHLEAACRQSYPNLILDHRYRAELRFYHNTNTDGTALEDGYHFENIRIRYRLQATIPIWKLEQKSLVSLKVSDEIHLNTQTHLFDQNRLYLGVQFRLTDQLSVEAGYMKILQERSNGNYYNRDLARFTLFHKMILSSK